MGLRRTSCQGLPTFPGFLSVLRSQISGCKGGWEASWVGKAKTMMLAHRVPTHVDLSILCLAPPGSKKWVCPAQPLLQSGWPSTALLPTSSREHRRRCGEQLTAFMSTPAPDPCSRTGNLPSSPRLMCSNVFPQPGLCSPRGFQSPYGAFHWWTLFRGIKGWQFLFV